MQTPVARRTMTAEAFEQYAALPENRERRLELISGDVVESFADFYSFVVGAAAGAAIGMDVVQHKLGRVTGANGGYAVGNDRLMPTVAYCSGPRPLSARKILWNPVAPGDTLSGGDVLPGFTLAVADIFPE